MLPDACELSCNTCASSWLQLRPVEWANIVFTSATTGQRVKRVLDAATAAAEEHRRRVTTATLNLVLQVRACPLLLSCYICCK